MMPLSTVRLFVFLLVLLPAALLRAQPQHCRDGFAEPPRVDPRNPEVICLPELGRMYGTLHCADFDGNTEHFGQEIIPIGDVNQDKLDDWTVLQSRCDSSKFAP